ncbi:MAG TPA: polysaccharide biosynthesis tyrosine autokinase [Aquabacterium sp.]|uniref:polysaccharide biosynthesis tyrosine autokinase n=1 Tax=Aquabacterium sp. TaxID=1872578 RepID=UPI002E30E095|nr:polysaccharide biosynthesis tyrosine autokinase [Aquabacterium sp.]HEX5373458.1 polysaccharide biosynthesis tyrosine autokinase [Aquabacterium sp.]
MPNPGEGQSIGDIIRQTNNLSAEQVERILSYQMQNGVKFGEAAVALGFAKEEDVLWALAQQFHFPYVNQANRKIAAEVIVGTKPFSDQSELFRAMRGQLLNTVFSKEEGHHALAVISPESGDGKSYYAANLAAALSQLGGRTLLIDADLRSPRQHEIFAIESKVGLSSILSGRAESRLIHPVEELPSLHVLPAGVVPPNPTELIQRPTFGLLVKELTTKFDYVIVDTPAASLGSDARVIATHCGAALAVCRRHKSRIDALQALLSPLTISSSVALAGVVVNEF